MYELWEDLKRLKRCRWVELSHPLNNDSPYWGGIPEGAVELSKTVYDWGNELERLIQGKRASWEPGDLHRISWTGAGMEYHPFHEPWKTQHIYSGF